MALPPKIILHAPVSDEAALSPFVERCIRDKVDLIAVIGEGSADLSLRIDLLLTADGHDPARHIVTTSHAGEPIEDVRVFVETWSVPDGRIGVLEVRL